MKSNLKPTLSAAVAVALPAKRFMYPPYSYVANYYWKEDTARGGVAKKK
jgi:hypothetical protein